jgi:hypothetical protein
LVHQLSSTENAKECISKFDESLPKFSWLSEVKKIDCLLGVCGRVFRELSVPGRIVTFFTSKEIVIFFGAILININNGIAKRVTTVPMAIIVFMDPYSVSRWHQSESVYQSVRRSIGEGEKICTSEVSAFPS